jgi:beta-N-acetylhexosaminidase
VTLRPQPRRWRTTAPSLAAALLFAACSSVEAPETSPFEDPVGTAVAAGGVEDLDGSGGQTEPSLEPSSVPDETIGVPDPVADLAPEAEDMGNSTSLDCVAQLPLETRLGQVLMVFAYGDSLDPVVEAARRWELGGAILMRWPDGADPARIADLTGAGSLPLHLAVDEEGGDVQRLRSFGRLASQREVAATMGVDAAEAMIASHASELARFGITMVFAPVADVSPSPGPDSAPDTMRSRAFSSDPDVVVEYTNAYLRAWSAAGIIPVLKHFPGHGSAAADTHEAAASTPPLSELMVRDLIPYRRIGQRNQIGVMTGHLDVPGLTDAEGVPASLSTAAVTGLLRGELGFQDALVITDALNMRAITDRFSTPQAALLALRAGSDIILYASVEETEAIISGLSDALATGELSLERLDESVERVLKSKGIDPCILVGSSR